MLFARLSTWTATAVVIGFTCAPAPATAQGTPPPVKVVVGANVGLAQPATDVFSNVLAANSGPDRNELRGEYPLESGPIFDASGGVIVGPGVFIGGAFTHATSSAPASLTLSLTHPAFHPTLTATTESGSRDRSENGLHLQFGYAVPTKSRLGVIVFGGPSYIHVNQPLFADAYVDEEFAASSRTWRAIVSDPETKRVSAGAWGYNVGTDVSWSLTRNVGIGGLVRYSRATVSLENPLAPTFDIAERDDDFKAGGLELSAGIRFRF